MNFKGKIWCKLDKITADVKNLIKEKINNFAKKEDDEPKIEVGKSFQVEVEREVKLRAYVEGKGEPKLK
jgi:hypothetical protein